MNWDNKKTYNVFANGKLIYLGNDEEAAIQVANAVKGSGDGRLTAIGNGYYYDIATW